MNVLELHSQKKPRWNGDEFWNPDDFLWIVDWKADKTSFNLNEF